MSTCDEQSLESWLNQVFPVPFADAHFDIAKLLSGFEEHMAREIKDVRIPINWTETELQWDPICSALFDHASQTGGEQLAWMLVKLVADRIHGQWKVQGNGGRYSVLSDAQSRENWLFAIRARIGVVDGWLRQNGQGAYSRYLFEALSNPVLLNIAPKTTLWDLDGASDTKDLYDRLVDVMQLPVSSPWLREVDKVTGVSMLSELGQQKVADLTAVMETVPKRERKRWQGTSIVAMQTVLQDIQKQVYSAHIINRALLGYPHPSVGLK